MVFDLNERANEVYNKLTYGKLAEGGDHNPEITRMMILLNRD